MVHAGIDADADGFAAVAPTIQSQFHAVATGAQYELLMTGAAFTVAPLGHVGITDQHHRATLIRIRSILMAIADAGAFESFADELPEVIIAHGFIYYPMKPMEAIASKRSPVPIRK